MPDENDGSPTGEASDLPVEPPETPRGELELHASFSGPLPPPAILEGYNRLVPKGAERLFAWAEEEGRHQRELQETAQAAQIEDLREVRKERRRGQRFGFAIALAGIAAGVGLALAGHPTPASVLLGSTLLGMVVVFVVGHYYESKADE